MKTKIVLILALTMTALAASHTRPPKGGGGNRTPLTITTLAVPNGQVGVSYSYTLRASGGWTPYTWSVPSGTSSLDSGLHLSASSGTLSGTPAAASTYSFTARVVDSRGATYELAYALVIAPANPPPPPPPAPALQIDTPSLPDGQENVIWSNTVLASNGTEPYTWSISAGALPTNLTINAGTGVIGSTPTTAGTYSFTVLVTDNVAATASRSYSVTIAPAPPPPVPVTILTPPLPDGLVGASYSQLFSASGGTGPYTWAKLDGTFPTGLTLTTATLSGTPTTAGTYNFTIQATDALAATASQSYTVHVAQSLAITKTSLLGGTVSAPYSDTLTASGGTAPRTWSITVGSLPAGLSLNAASGAITGTPTVALIYPFTVKVTDAVGAYVTKQFSITISSATLIADRPYTTTSPWNTLIPATPNISPNSAALVTSLVNDGTFSSDTSQYTMAVYEVSNATPLVPVTVSGIFKTWTCNTCNHSSQNGATIYAPIPSSALPATGTDGQMILWNRDNGDEWAFWQLSTGEPRHATNGYKYNTNWSAVTSSQGPRGAGVPYLAGLIRQWEINQGHIDHAIAISMHATAGSYVWPASSTDGSTSGGVPEGTRFQLDPTISDATLTSWGCTNPNGAGLTIAHALQLYGMIVIDSSGHPKAYAQWGANTWSPTSVQTNTVQNCLNTHRASFRALDPAYHIGSQ